MALRGPSTLAGQMVALLIAVVAVVILGGSVLAAVEDRRHSIAAARAETVGIATALAEAPSTAAALESPWVTEALQPLTERIQSQAGIESVSVVGRDGTRLTDSDPHRIGTKYPDSVAPALAGETLTGVRPGGLAPVVHAVVPVRNDAGEILGLVSAGVAPETLAGRWHAHVAKIGTLGAGALALSFLGAWAIHRRLMHQTHGLRPDELRLMYENYDAILHSVTEGLVVLDRNEVGLVNGEARRLLGLPAGPVRRSDLPAFLRADDPGVRDEVHVTDDRVLVVNRSTVSGTGSEVVTIRDRTELQGALGELSSLKILTDSLRAQAHESANRLHTVITMVEMGRPEDAVRFATHELELSQHLVDRLSAAVGEPALVALLLGKVAQADERGVALTITEDTQLPSDADSVPLSGQEMVTVVGNLIDNALDACDRDDPWVEVTVNQDDRRLLIRVADSGPGMDELTFAKAMQRGYSTKTAAGDDHRGLGLALVAQVIARHGGTLTTDDGVGSVVTARFGRT